MFVHVCLWACNVSRECLAQMHAHVQLSVRTLSSHTVSEGQTVRRDATVVETSVSNFVFSLHKKRTRINLIAPMSLSANESSLEYRFESQGKMNSIPGQNSFIFQQ